MADSITYWAWNVAARAMDDAASDLPDDVGVPSYEAENEGATITVEELGDNVHEQRFQTAVTSGTGAPDLTALQNYDMLTYASQDSLTDVTDRIDEAGIREDIVAGKWRAVQYGGQDFGLPWDLGPTGMYYKRDQYADAGIDPDAIETWDDFIEEGQKLPDDAAMINLPQSDELPQFWRMLFRQLGGQPITEDGAVNIHSEESVRVAQLIADLQDSGITRTVGMWSSSWFTAFAEGTIATLPSAAWMDGTLRAELPDTAGNWGVYKLPAFEEGGNRASNRGGSNVAIPAQIEDEGKVSRAWDYALYVMTTPEIQNYMLEEYGLFPSLSTAYNADLYEESQDFYDGQAIYSLFAEVAENIEPYRYNEIQTEINNAISTELDNLLNGDKSPEQAMQDAAETVADREDRDLA
ncbi:sugar ABC transporter substrate-binding protein [Halorubrum trapanicum]